MPMKMPLKLAVLILLQIIAGPQLSTFFAQGSLTPPGAPAPTMKTLDQLEPRIPLTMNTAPGDNAYQFIIAHAGSYYLTTNLIGLPSKSAIRILTNDVDLNLNGYSVTGVSNSIGGVTVAFNVFNVS